MFSAHESLTARRAACVVQDCFNTKGMCCVSHLKYFKTPRVVGLGNGQDFNQYNAVVPRTECTRGFPRILVWWIVSHAVQLPGNSGDIVARNISEYSSGHQKQCFPKLWPTMTILACRGSVNDNKYGQLSPEICHPEIQNKRKEQTHVLIETTYTDNTKYYDPESLVLQQIVYATADTSFTHIP